MRALGEFFPEIGAASHGLYLAKTQALGRQPGDVEVRKVRAGRDIARELGAQRLTLVSPYLAYMRQDKAFHPGEAVTSDTFARLISSLFDGLVTVDPHLHRRAALAAVLDGRMRHG